jgi:predicted TIM-barrel fold metal-dependent hydrolase
LRNIFSFCAIELRHSLYAGEDNLVIGTDYGHSDNASEIEALRKLKNEGRVAAGTINKILNDNPRALYSL